LDASIDQYLGMSQRGSGSHAALWLDAPQISGGFCPWNAVKRGRTKNELWPPDLLGSIAEMGLNRKLLFDFKNTIDHTAIPLFADSHVLWTLCFTCSCEWSGAEAGELQRRAAGQRRLHA
jgi:hypothetical protein